MPTPLHFQTLHGRQTVHADPQADPANLAALLAAKRLPLNTRCNGRGLCNGCAVRLESGELRDLRASDGGARSSTACGKALAPPGELLACKAEWLPGNEATISIPSRSLLAHQPSVADDFQIKVPTGNAPLFGGEYGVAIDIGTTTVVVLLAEMGTGRIVARASHFNQQIRLGDDVLARIERCPGDLAELQAAVARDTLGPLIAQACQRAGRDGVGIRPEQLGGLSIAANSTMLHLLFGVDPSAMGVSPFTPAFIGHRVGTAGGLGIPGVPPALPVHALPGLAAYVGADISAGIFATGLHYNARPTLFVDVGTNGEIVLVKDDRLYACATAAGPAFEGSGLSSGMRAAEGAVEKIAFTKMEPSGHVEMTLGTIGNVPLERSPGICGSAYIDFLAQARSGGLLMESGRFAPEAVAANPGLFAETPFGPALHLRPPQSEQGGGSAHPLTITGPDIAGLLQAKGAIAAGIQTLLEIEGLLPADIHRVYLAGGFGMHIDLAHAVACGLLPGFDPAQIETVGNTSLAGAYLALLDREVIDELERLRARTEIIELNLQPGFEDCYIDNLSLP